MPGQCFHSLSCESWVQLAEKTQLTRSGAEIYLPYLSTHVLQKNVTLTL